MLIIFLYCSLLRPVLTFYNPGDPPVHLTYLLDFSCALNGTWCLTGAIFHKRKPYNESIYKASLPFICTNNSRILHITNLEFNEKDPAVEMLFTPTAMFFVNCTQSREVSSFIHNLWSIPSKIYYHKRGREREQQLYERHILGKTVKRIKGDMLTQLLEKGRFTDNIKSWVTGRSDITEYSKVLPFLNVSLPLQNEVVLKEIKEGSFNFTTENGRSTKSVALQTEGSGESNIETSTTISEGSDSPAAQPIHTSTSETYYNSSSTPENSESSKKDVNPSSQDNQLDKVPEEMKEEIIYATLKQIPLIDQSTTTSVLVQTIGSEKPSTEPFASSIVDTEQLIKTTDAASDLILATENPEEHHFSAQSTQNSLFIENNTEPTTKSSSETHNSSTPEISKPSQEDIIVFHVSYSNHTDDDISILIKNSSDIFDVHNSSSELPDALNTTSKPSFSLKDSNTETEVQNSNSMTSTSETYNISTTITLPSQEDRLISSVEYGNQTDDYASTLIKNSSDIFDVHNSSSELPEASHTTFKPLFNPTNSNTETEITNLYIMTTTSETYNISTPITSQSLQQDGLISSDEYGNQTDDFASTLIKNSSDIFDVHNSSSEIPDALHTTSKPSFSLKNSNTETKVPIPNTFGNGTRLAANVDNATRTLAMDDYLNLRPPSSIQASNKTTTVAGHSVTTPAPTTVRQSLLSRLVPSTLHAKDRMLTSTELPKTTTRYLSKCAKDRIRNNKSVRKF